MTSLRSSHNILSKALLRSKATSNRRNFILIVEQGKEAWRLSLGKNPTRLGPGIHINIPVYHEVQRVDMRESSLAIADLSGYTSDNVPVTCSGSLFFRITDGYKACFGVSDVEENIRRTGTSAMRSVLGSFSYDSVIGNRNSINEKLNTVIGDSIVNWGVVCTRFEIQGFKPANREVERQLELQMEAERNRRKQLLDTQAAVNVAEGHKQRVILESEGHLIARSNEADASYKTVYREAEARKEQALMEASALAQQVEALARSLAPPNEQVTSNHLQKALDKLIEVKRLDQLRAIASSQSNSTYFFGSQNVLGQDPYSIDYAEHVKGRVVNAKNVGGPASAIPSA